MSRFPHPLAHLQQRAWNAKTAPERHRASFCVWEAAIKLLGFVSLVRLGELKRRKRDLSEQVQELACPTLRDWWNWSRHHSF